MILQEGLPAALPFRRADRLDGLVMVAEGDGEGVRRIQVAGLQLDAEGLLQHHPDLLLGGGAVADDGFLGLAGGVFRYGSDPGLETGDDGGALGPAELQHIPLP